MPCLTIAPSHLRPSLPVPAPYKVDLSFNGNTFESDGFLVWAVPNGFLEVASQGIFGVFDPTVYATLNGAPANAAFQFEFLADGQNTFTSLPQSITNTVGAHGYLIDSNQNVANFNIGNIAVATVPLPASGWLFGSALIGLIGVVRKRKTA